MRAAQMWQQLQRRIRRHVRFGFWLYDSVVLVRRALERNHMRNSYMLTDVSQWRCVPARRHSSRVRLCDRLLGCRLFSGGGSRHVPAVWHARQLRWCGKQFCLRVCKWLVGNGMQRARVSGLHCWRQAQLRRQRRVRHCQFAAGVPMRVWLEWN